jgi:hypothetical protein
MHPPTVVDCLKKNESRKRVSLLGLFIITSLIKMLAVIIKLDASIPFNLKIENPFAFQ